MFLHILRIWGNKMFWANFEWRESCGKHSCYFSPPCGTFLLFFISAKFKARWTLSWAFLILTGTFLRILILKHALKLSTATVDSNQLRELCRLFFYYRGYKFESFHIVASWPMHKFSFRGNFCRTLPLPPNPL